MTFWQIFVRVLPWRPFAAMQCLWWHISGRRLRARNRLRAAGARLSFAYEAWMQGIERGRELENRLAPIAASWPWRPRFSVLLHLGAGGSGDDVERSINSVQRQLYPHWTLFISGAQPRDDAITSADGRIRALQGSGEAVQDALEISVGDEPGDFIVLVQPGNELSPWALFRIAEALQSDPKAKIVYGDHDVLDDLGRRVTPWFKPRWNEEMFLARDYLSGAVALKTEAARSAVSELSPGASFYELLLHAARNDEAPVIHVPHIVAHLRSEDRASDQMTRIDAVGRHVADAGATAAGGPFDSVKVSWPLPAHLPLVSIIIPTKDKIELLRPCVESVLARTTYEPFEILILDNGSAEERTIRYLDEIVKNSKVRVLPYPGPYNFSAMNNRAAGEATGTYLCLLNNDTEVVDDQWLTEMMRYAVRADVGAVGAKLLYPDRTIQHAGVVVGMGDAAGHVHRNLPDTDPGYFCQVHVAQSVTAVTGACLLVGKEKFLAVGGFDEEQLAVAYNDVDLCLKLGRAGWRNIYVPHAVLIHHESKSRGKDHSPSQIDRYRRELKTFQDRWGTKTFDDPLLNPNLDRTSETFLIRL